MSEQVLLWVVVVAIVCGALIGFGLLGAIVNVSHLEAEAERERGGEA